MGLTMLVWPNAASSEGLTYLAHPPLETGAHPPLIVLLHGSGADERDMIGLWRQLPGRFVVISPRAPFADGAGGFRWYGRPARSGREDSRAADIVLSRKTIDHLVEDAVKRFDADPRKVFVAGFSQGAVMAYDLGLNEPGRFAGAAVLSGSLFPFETAALPARSALSKEPFFIAHGTKDDRIPFGAAQAARAKLTTLGLPVEFHAYDGLHHGTSDAEIADLSRWLVDHAAL
jgi:phospholipase/carboxylesterase